MKIALGFFGFVRYLDTDVETFRKRIQNEGEGGHSVDVFFSVPNQSREFEGSPMAEADIRTLCADAKVSLYDYDPFPYIEQADELQWPQFCSKWHLLPFRIVSLAHSVGRLARMLSDQTDTYDLYILTRVDMIPHVIAFGSCIEPLTNNQIKGWRTSPNRSGNCAEDRIMFSSKSALEVLIQFPNHLPIGKFHISEVLLGDYLIDKAEVLDQEGIELELMETRYIKYSPDFMEKCRVLFNTYRERKQLPLFEWILSDSNDPSPRVEESPSTLVQSLGESEGSFPLKEVNHAPSPMATWLVPVLLFVLVCMVYLIPFIVRRYHRQRSIDLIFTYLKPNRLRHP